MDIGDADRLAAEGIPVEIAGHHFHARWSNRAMFAAEKRYGSLSNVSAVMLRVGQSGKDGQEPVPLYATTYYLLALALQHERVSVLKDGDPPVVNEDWLLDNADSRQVLTYLKAASDAFAQALPDVATSDNAAAPSGANPTTPSQETATDPTTIESPGDDSAGSPSPNSEPPSTTSGTE